MPSIYGLAMISSKRLRSVAAILLLLLVMMAAVIIWGNSRPPAFLLQIPATNAYLIWVKAASHLTGPDPRFVTNNFSAAYEPNRVALDLWRSGLPHSAELPQDWYHSTVGNEIRSIYQLTLTAALEARQFEQENKWTNAAEIYLNIVKTGHSISHGPLISLLFGIAAEKNGLNGLNRVAPRLTSVQGATFVKNLQYLQRTRITMDQVRGRDRYFLQRNSPNLLTTLLGPLTPRIRKALNLAESKLDRIRDDLEICRKNLEEAAASSSPTQPVE